MRKRTLFIRVRDITLRLLIASSTLLSTVLPSAAEIQRPAGTAASNPYNYVSTGTINNPSGSATQVTAAVLTENSYTTNTGLCGTDVNNGKLQLTYNPTLTDDLYVYTLTKTGTNLKTNQTTTEKIDLGANTNPPYKLLNIYPNSGSNYQYRVGHTLMTANRSDGGKYYEDPFSGEQMFTFDEVYWPIFMINPEQYLKNADGTWKYDGIYFGATDNNANGDGEAQRFGDQGGGAWSDWNKQIKRIIRQYADSGHAVVMGHDVDIISVEDTAEGEDTTLFDKYFGHDNSGILGPQGEVVYVNDNSGTGGRGSSSDGNKLTRYPYKFSMGEAVPISFSHVQKWPSIEKTDVWLTYAPSATIAREIYYGNPYLYTSKQYPNVANSQAGHTVPLHENDLKLIVNMLLYMLPKRTTPKTMSTTVKDIAAPKQPDVTNLSKSGANQFKFDVASFDYGTKFDFTLQADGIYNGTQKSPVTMNGAVIESGIKWYLYSLDSNSNGTPSYTVNCLGLPVPSGSTQLVEGGKNENMTVTVPTGAKYLHIAAVDRAGNISEVRTVELPQNKEITVSKTWSDFNNKFNFRPSQVIYDAFASGSTVSSGNCTATAANSYKCTISNLPSGVVYTIKERAINTYTANTANVSVDGTAATLTNTLVTKQINVSKQWEMDQNNKFSTRPANITFDAVYNNTVYGSCQATAQNNWSCAINDIPVYNASGTEIIYTIKEHTDLKAYESDSVSVSSSDTTASVTNTLVTKDIEVTKSWSKDQNNAFNTRPANTTFDAVYNNTVYGSCQATSDSGWKCVIKDLPVYNTSGTALNYTIKERSVPKAYSTTDVSVSGADAKKASVTNTLVMKNIQVTKTWTDQNNKFQLRPAEIVFNAYIGDKVLGSCTANAASSWECTIADLAKYDSAGNVISYKIKEKKVPSGYTASEATVSTENGTTAAITNTMKVRDITVTKVWVDYDNKFAVRPASVTYDVFIGTGTVSMGNCTATPSSSWKCTITGLPEVDSNGNAIIYVFKERDVPKAYTATTSTVNNASSKATSTSNTLIVKEIEVAKIFSDQENKFSTRPSNLTFEAYIGTTSYGSCTASASSSWKCKIPNLAVYNTSGAPLTYTIKERTVPKAYTTQNVTVSGADTKTASVTNSLVMKNIQVTKTWADQNNAFDTRPVSIVFDVFAPNLVSSLGSCEANQSNGWKCSIKDLAVYDKNEQPIAYTVREREVPAAYTSEASTIRNASDNTVSITNTLQTKDILITKNWEDNNNRFNTRPVAAIIDVYWNGSVIRSCETSVANNWQCSATNLPVYKKDGSAQPFTVKERTVPNGYTATTETITDKSTDTAFVTNALITKPVYLVKRWDDGGDTDTVRPEKINVKLYSNGTEIASTELSVADKITSNVWWKQFDELPVYDKNGNIAVYTMKEFLPE